MSQVKKMFSRLLSDTVTIFSRPSYVLITIFLRPLPDLVTMFSSPLYGWEKLTKTKEKVVII